MKKILFLLAVIISFTACQKIKNLANIGFDAPFSQTVTVPPVPGYTYGMAIPGGATDLPFPPLAAATNAQQYFDQYHASRKNVVSANLTSLTMQITSPAAQTFDFLNSVQLYISTESQPEVLVAFLNNVPKGQKTITLNITPGLNLKDYVDGDSVIIRLDANVNAVPISGTQVLSQGNFHMVANPL